MNKKELASIDRIALLPRHGICCVASPYVDNARFVRVWRETWAQLPLYARRSLLGYWRSLLGYEQGFAPSFFCVSGCISERGEDKNALGFWKPIDGSTQYLAEAVNLMPDDILATLIAHELAHPVHRLSWKFSRPQDFRSEQYFRNGLVLKDEFVTAFDEFDDEEQDVRELHDGWGFSEEDFCQWLDENREQLEAARNEFASAYA